MKRDYLFTTGIDAMPRSGVSHWDASKMECDSNWSRMSTGDVPSGVANRRLGGGN